MRYLRGALTFIVFAVAASGSIWIGWIYASPHPRVDMPTPPSSIPGSAVAPSGAGELSRIPVQDLGSLPGFGSVTGLPGVEVPSTMSTNINGFPTISKEAVERAAGYSVQPLPEADLPFKLGESADPLGKPSEITPR